jgi:hypothetical protein
MAINYKSNEEYCAIIQYLEDKVRKLEDEFMYLRQNSILKSESKHSAQDNPLYPIPRYQMVSKHEIINGAGRIYRDYGAMNVD